MCAERKLPDIFSESFGTTLKRLCIVVVFSIAFAYIESAVVVYLREIFHPDGFIFPLTDFGSILQHKKLLLTEIGREAATILMIGAVALVSARRSWSDRTANFFYVFGIWDIFYYVFLKLLIDWPESLLTTDVYFLIPVPWIGPVIVPVACSVIIIAVAVVMKWKTRPRS